MIKKIKLFFSNIADSLNNKPGNGYSARKLTALFAIVLMAGYITIKLLPVSDMLHALYAWQLLGLLCLGIITVEQIIKFRTGTSTTTTEEKSETKTEIIKENK